MGNLKTLAQGKNLKRMLAGLEQEIAGGVSLYAHRKLEQTVGHVTPVFKITHSNVIVYRLSHENIGDIEIHTLQPNIMEFDVPIALDSKLTLRGETADGGKANIAIEFNRGAESYQDMLRCVVDGEGQARCELKSEKKVSTSQLISNAHRVEMSSNDWNDDEYGLVDEAIEELIEDDLLVIEQDVAFKFSSNVSNYMGE